MPHNTRASEKEDDLSCLKASHSIRIPARLREPEQVESSQPKRTDPLCTSIKSKCAAKLWADSLQVLLFSHAHRSPSRSRSEEPRIEDGTLLQAATGDHVPTTSRKRVHIPPSPTPRAKIFYRDTNGSVQIICDRLWESNVDHIYQTMIYILNWTNWCFSESLSNTYMIRLDPFPFKLFLFRFHMIYE